MIQSVDSFKLTKAKWRTSMLISIMQTEQSLFVHVSEEPARSMFGLAVPLEDQGQTYQSHNIYLQNEVDTNQAELLRKSHPRYPNLYRLTKLECQPVNVFVD